MGSNRPFGQRYPYPHQNNPTTVGPPGTHNINRQFAPRPNPMGLAGPANNGGGQYYPTPNNQYYPPPPPAPRPPQAIRMMPPGAPDPLMPPGTSNAVISNPLRGPTPPPPVISPASLQGIMTFAPLEPPPLPPLFPYLSPELAQSLQQGATQYGQTFDQRASDLPFVPVIINDRDLKKMTETLKNAAEDKGTNSANLLLYEDILDQRLPKALKEMCQPLYCKLCQLTLSSPVVARDHYKGKRHKRAEEIWQQKNPSKNNINPGTNSERQNLSNPQELKATSLINGTVRPAGQQQFDRRSSLVPNSGQYGISGKRPAALPPSSQRDVTDRRPFPVPGPSQYQVNRKRPSEQIPRGVPSGIGNTHQFANDNEYIPAYRAALAGTTNKRPKKEDGSGPNFGFCEPCQVALTSQANSDQHYNGKKHKEKILQGRKCGDFGEDPRYGIGSSFPSRPDGAHNTDMNRRRYD